MDNGPLTPAPPPPSAKAPGKSHYGLIAGAVVVAIILYTMTHGPSRSSDTAAASPGVPTAEPVATSADTSSAGGIAPIPLPAATTDATAGSAPAPTPVQTDAPAAPLPPRAAPVAAVASGGNPIFGKWTLIDTDEAAYCQTYQEFSADSATDVKSGFKSTGHPVYSVRATSVAVSYGGPNSEEWDVMGPDDLTLKQIGPYTVLSCRYHRM